MNAFATIDKTESKQNTGNSFLGNAKNSTPFIQPKLTINQPNDPDNYRDEQEADAMADKIMLMETPMLQTKTNDNSFFKPTSIPVTHIQRKCTHCEEEEEKKMQRKEMNDAETTADNNLENYVGNLNSNGQSLPNELRNFYEPRFGYDFSNVKIHSDPVAVKSAQSINALAYTSGNNIVFNNGQYSPDTESGKRLLGHELTHVVQQNKTGVQKKSIQRLVRTSLVTCGAGQNPFGADRRASTLLANAVTLIDNAVAARPVDPANADVATVGSAMHTAFRLNPANGSNWNDPAPHFGLPLIRRRLDAAKNYIDSVVFTFNCVANGANHTIPGCATFACAAGTEAVSCHNNPTEMVLCPDFWALSTNQRARTYLHEVLHITFRVVDDWGQHDQHNAHCYAQFVALLNGFNSPAGFRCH